MPFTPKDWRDATGHDGGGDTTTPLTAAALEDLETRLAAYADTLVANTTSSTYVPGLTNVTNLSASSDAAAQYIRVGSIVHVGGLVNIDPVAAAAIQLEMTLPIASNLGASSDLTGVSNAPFDANEALALVAETDTNKAALVGVATQTTLHTTCFMFTYRII
jgi:hypothetical protein